MKKIILLFSLALSALSAQAQTTGTWNKVNARDTFGLSGRQLAEVVYSILVTSKNNEIPTAKSVWDLVQSEIGDKISGTGEAPRVAYFTDNDQIGGDPDLTFDDADNILLVQDISLDGSNNEITAGAALLNSLTVSDPNAAAFISDPSSSGPIGGGNLILVSNDGVGISANDRLGGIAFRGDIYDGATIEAFAEGAFSGGSQPTGLRFSTIPNGSGTIVPRVTISENGDLGVLGGKELKIFDSDNTNSIGLKAPATGTLTTNLTVTLPPDHGTSGQQLTTDGAGGWGWADAMGGGVSEPATQVVSGTGTGITSSADFIHDISGNRIEMSDDLITRNPTKLNTPSAWETKFLGEGVSFAATSEVATGLRVGQIGFYAETFGLGVVTTQSVATACPSIRFYRAKVDGSGNAIPAAQNDPIAFFGFQNHKGQVTNLDGFYSNSNGGIMFGAFIDTVGSSGQVASRLDFYTKSVSNTGSIPTGSLTMRLKSNGDIYLPFYSTSRNDAGTPAVVLSIDASNRVTAHPVSELPGGATDHGALTGLSDDDHAQYLLLAGRSGGQVATGGTGSGDDLTLRSTTDATKGDIILNDQGGNTILGGGELSGELRFMEPAGSGSNYTGFKSGAMGANQMYTLPTDAPSDGEVLTWGTGNILSWGAGGGSGNYQTWKEDGSSATVQPNANFVTTTTIAPTLTNDAGNSETEVTFDIVGGSVNSTHLNQMGAADNQVLKWDGSGWGAAYMDDDIYPSDITVDVNNYTPTDWDVSSKVFVSSSAIWTITGFGALAGGTDRTVINDGDFPFVIACHHTGSDVGNRVLGREDIVVLPGDAVTLTYNNNVGRWYVSTNTFYPQKLGTVWNGIYYYQQPGSTNQSDHSFLGLASSGTSAGNANEVPAAEQANHWDVSTGSTAAGVATVYLPKNANNFARTGDGHIEVQANVFVPTVSTSAQRYTLQVGMIPNANTTTLNVNNSVVVRYKDDVNGGEFELVTRNNAGTETAVDCNVAVTADTPYQITVVLNESRTEARAYINGTLAAINTSTMPNAAVSVGARVGIFKSVGTTARFAKIGSIVGFVVL